MITTYTVYKLFRTPDGVYTEQPTPGQPRLGFLDLDNAWAFAVDKLKGFEFVIVITFYTETEYQLHTQPMNTPTIPELADHLRHHIKSDNDAPRLIAEHIIPAVGETLTMTQLLRAVGDRIVDADTAMDFHEVARRIEPGYR